MWITCRFDLLAYFMIEMIARVTCWYQPQAMPNFIGRDPEQEILSEFRTTQPDEALKLLIVEKNKAFVGGKNHLYLLNLTDFSVIFDLQWLPTDTAECRSNEEYLLCANYIRIAVRKKNESLFICGTNAHKPLCRDYTMNDKGVLSTVDTTGRSGDGLCPHDIDQNYTFMYHEEQYYSAIRDLDKSITVFLMKDAEGRTIQINPRNLRVFNSADFVGMLEKEDKVYLLYREIAVELQEQVVVSRISSLCKSDKGITDGRLKIFHTLFKSRLNCYVPGGDRFFFNEIVSVSPFGWGSYKFIKLPRDQVFMFYALFNTAKNSFEGSAVCAFLYSTATAVFRGQFKGQESLDHKWNAIPTAATPIPHPAQCANTDQGPDAQTINFTKRYSLMNDDVPCMGPFPVLIVKGLRAKVTHMAIDWQVATSNNRFYDVIFLGTDDGRVIKGYNNADGSRPQPVIVEDIQVLKPGEPVADLKVVPEEKLLVVMSKESVIAIPLARCIRAETYKQCKILRDPYCPCVE